MTVLHEHKRGLIVESSARPGMFVLLWFYEWNMFEACAPGQHTPGRWPLPRRIEAGGRTATIEAPDLKLECRAVEDGAELSLSIHNQSGYAWPEPAGLIPCFNAGHPDGVEGAEGAPNRALLDLERQRTYFAGPDGLERLQRREIHFNARLKPAIDRLVPNGRFVFSEKWPTSERLAQAGLLLRESADRSWVAGIAWDHYLSAQGLNPWNCMHLGIHAGPLKPGEQRHVRGRIYLFQGVKEDLWAKYQADFAKI